MSQSVDMKRRRLNELNKEKVLLEAFIQDSEARSGIRLTTGGLDTGKRETGWNNQTGVPFLNALGDEVFRMKIADLPRVCAFLKGIGEKNGIKMA